MIRCLSIAVVVMAVAAVCAAQQQNAEAIPGTKSRTLAGEKDLPTDPRLAENGKLPLKIEVRSSSAMTQEEKDLESAAKAAIRDGAALYELGPGEGDWQENVIACPAFPQHLFLRYTRNAGSGDVSMFSASIPRVSGGRVRVIPILRRGYSLISPAPESRLTIGAFNHIRVEEHMDATADWSAVSECYAALTSERWTLTGGDATLATVGLQTLKLEEHGVLSVAMQLDDPAPGRWVVTYDRAGQLVKTEYTAFGDLVWRRVPAPVTELKGRPFPLPVEAPQGRTVQSGPEPKGKPLPPATDNPGKPQ